MLENPLQSVSKFVLDIAKHGEVALSSKQQALVSRLITAMVLLGSFKTTAVSSLFLMKISPAAVYAMLRRSALPFDRLFWGCLKLVIKLFKIRSIYITIDDTERERSKNCRILPFVRKTLCKATGGWVQAQNIVFIVLVTQCITIPIWFCFHRPANLSKEQKRICKKNPTKIKDYDRKYRSKVDLACLGLFVVSRILRRLEKEMNACFKVKCAVADNGFACSKIQRIIARYFGCQYVSKANPKQNAVSKGHSLSLEKYFERFSPVSKNIIIRGRELNLEYKAARTFVSSFGRKVFVVAIRNKKDSAWRYLFGTDLTWNSESIIKAYGLRWLVEVFFEDWKKYDGWGVGALQRSAEGAARGLYLSLLTDLFLLYYQRTNASLQERGRHELYSAGTVIRYLQAEAFHEAIEGVLEHENPRKKLAEIREKMIEVADRRISLKHAHRWNLDDLEPTPSLVTKWGKRNRAEERAQRDLKRT